MNTLENRIKIIEERNQKVETDKKWETSKSRKFTIAILTYFVIVIFFFSLKLAKPFINAIVPTIGFLLSTLSLPFFKKLWIKHNKQ